MSKVVKLTLSIDDHDQLHRVLEGTRSTTTTVKVDRQALANLLIDHGRLLKEVQHEQEVENDKGSVPRRANPSRTRAR